MPFLAAISVAVVAYRGDGRSTAGITANGFGGRGCSFSVFLSGVYLFALTVGSFTAHDPLMANVVVHRHMLPFADIDSMSPRFMSPVLRSLSQEIFGAEYGYPHIYGCCGQSSTQERSMVIPTYIDAVASPPHRSVVWLSPHIWMLWSVLHTGA